MAAGFLTDWLSSLLSSTCAFCGDVTARNVSSCDRCVEQRLDLAEKQPLSSNCGLTVISLALYEGWLKDLILANKHAPAPSVVQELARQIARAIPRDWRLATFIAVPGSALKEEHLVEAIANELRQKAFTLPKRTPLKRSLWSFRSQKNLDAEERASRARAARFIARPERIEGDFVILDDVCTTGATLRGIRDSLERDGHSRCLGAVTIAWTELRLNDG